MKEKYVYVVNWGKEYTNITKYNEETKKRECIFPIKTKLPQYCGTDHHWEHIYKDNLTLKGTINKREPKILVEKIPKYKNYKWEIIETFKHHKAGEYIQAQQVREHWNDYSKFTENNLLLLASTHTDKDWMKCYIIIEETGVSDLTLEQYKDKQFNAMIEANLGKWDRSKITQDSQKQIPNEIISSLYSSDDNVLFGSSYVKGLVSYNYLDGKFSIDGKPIYLNCSISYDGKGNSQIEDKSLIKEYVYIQSYLTN